MKHIRIILILISTLGIFFSCTSSDSKKQQGITLNQTTENEEVTDIEGDAKSKTLSTRPGKILLTGQKDHRLVTVYKVNYDAKNREYFIGTNRYHYSYSEDLDDETNSRNNHFMPGIEAVYGYNMLNISHYNVKTKQKNEFFKHPVLINTLYYPSFLPDSIDKKPVVRKSYLISVYDEDTNKDSLINQKDLRRFYHFDITGFTKIPLVPMNYSVLSSAYDSANDHMFIYAKLDENWNGRKEEKEPIHIFWIDLKSPKIASKMY